MRTVVVALLLVLAGCNGLTARPTETTVTPAPVPTAGPATLDDVPGFGRSGVVELDAFLAAHRATFGDYPDARFRRTAVVTYRFENGTTYRLRHVRISAGERSLDVWNGSVPFSSNEVQNVTAWRNRSLLAVRTVTSDGNVSLRAQDAVGLIFFVSAVPLNLDVLPTVIAREDVRFEGGRVRDGTAEFLLVAEGLTEETVENVDRAFADPIPGVRSNRAGKLERAGPGRLRAVVTEDGLVRRFVLRVPARTDDASLVVTVDIAYDAVGTATAPPPSWVSRAVAGTDDRETVTGSS